MHASDAIIAKMVILRAAPCDPLIYDDMLQSLRDLIRVEFAHDFIVDQLQVHRAMSDVLEDED